MVTIVNTISRSGASALNRRKRDNQIRLSVRPSEVPERVDDGWKIEKVLKTTTRLMKPKSPSQLLEDRFWSVLYRMEFPILSDDGGALFKDSQGRVTDQIDVFGQDDEVMLLTECKYIGSRNTRLNYSEILGRLHGLREPAGRADRDNQTPNPKRRIVPCLVVSGGRPGDLAFQRSRELGVPILLESDLEYYESLVSHLGPAARFQLLADLLPGKEVPGLEIRVPAIKGEIGGKTIYTFSVHPDHLLRIAYVSHRMRGHGSDVTSYQRMVRKPRLEALRRYISNDGIFPTNIVVNLHQRPRFDAASLEGQSSSSRVGWLTLPSRYKSAWIIDGQHRLFAYSGHEYADRDFLTVVAFEQLDGPTQARLFVDINGEQKSVNRSLLNELFYQLHWNSDEPHIRTKAVISKAIQGLGEDSSESPFYGRVQSAEGASDEIKCITIAAMFSSLEKSNLFFEKKTGTKNIAYGPFWLEADNTKMVRRVNTMLNAWFTIIRQHAEEWWDLGKGSGGGLAMNDSIAAHIDVIRKVFEHLRLNGNLEWLGASDADLGRVIEPYAISVGKYLGSLSLEQRDAYRSLRGVQGQTTRSKRMQVQIRQDIPTFDPGDLDEFIESQRVETFNKSKEYLDEFELLIKDAIVETLRSEYPLEDDWWLEGVPKEVRTAAVSRWEGDKRERGGPENYLYLIDYRVIVDKNWRLFEKQFSMGTTSRRKDERTDWIRRLNDLRNIVAHPTSGRGIRSEEFAYIESLLVEFKAQIGGDDATAAAG